MYKTTTEFLGSFCSQQKPKPPVSGLHSFAYATTNNINHTPFIFIQSNTFRLLAILSHSLIHSVNQQSSNPLILFPLFQDFYFRFPFFLVFVKDRSIQQKENRGSREMRVQISRFFCCSCRLIVGLFCHRHKCIC